MSGNQYFDSLSAFEKPFIKGTLTWYDHAGMGYLPLFKTPYDDAYYQKYVDMDKTKMGRNLTRARVDLVNEFLKDGSLVDVGIGSGKFMAEIGCYGFDVNPMAIDLLDDTHRFYNPYEGKVENATFWDSLEHIEDIELILKNINQFVFVSIPIFKSVNHVLTSKHYRPDEHCFYFTDEGFKSFMDAHGFKVIECNTMETDLGREDIGTYVCERAHSISE